jgi:hypothetical protein
MYESRGLKLITHHQEKFIGANWKKNENSYAIGSYTSPVRDDLVRINDKRSDNGPQCRLATCPFKLSRTYKI